MIREMVYPWVGVPMALTVVLAMLIVDHKYQMHTMRDFMNGVRTTVYPVATHLGD